MPFVWTIAAVGLFLAVFQLTSGSDGETHALYWPLVILFATFVLAAAAAGVVWLARALRR